MHDPRMEFTATLLPSGLVLVAGGCLTADCKTILASAELYHPHTGSWATTGSMHQPRAFQTATLLPDGRVLVAGGIVGGCDTTLFCSPISAGAEIYDPRTGTWTMTGSMRQARARHTATLLPNGRVLVAGGAADGSNAATGNPLASAELYDPRTGKWTPTGSLRDAHYAHTAVLLRNGIVLVAGGYDGYYLASSAVLPAELYNIHTGKWTLTGSLHQGRDYDTGQAATLLSNGRVLVAGGYNVDSGGLASAETYDPHTGTWALTGSLRQALGWETATLLLNGQVLIAGGIPNSFIGTPSLDSAELYQP